MDDFGQKTHAFLAWFHSRRTAFSHKLELADLRHRNAGRGVVALHDIDADEELFTVHRNDILSVENSDFVKNDAGRRIVQDLDNPWLALIMVLMYEFTRADSSPWKPYLDLLPSDFNTPMFWSDHELEQLQASAVRGKIGKADADNMFCTKIIPAIRANSALFPATVSVSDQDLLHGAHRMGSTIMAYAFDIEKDVSQQEMDEDGYVSDEEDSLLPKGMIPMADMLNADADRNNARLFYHEFAVVMKALKPIKAGEEIFNDYGPLPRADLLRRYGYITPSYAQYDVVEIAQQLIIDVLRSQAPEQGPQDNDEALFLPQCTKADLHGHLLAEKLDYLDYAGALDDGYDIYRNPDSPKAFIPAELRVLLWVLNLPRADFDAAKSADKILEATLRSRDRDSMRFLRILLGILDARIAQYATSLEQDREMLARVGQTPMSSTSDERCLMALHVRLGEKEILAGARTKVDEWYREAVSTHQS